METSLRHILLVHGYGALGRHGAKANFVKIEPALKSAGFITHHVILPYGGMLSMEQNVEIFRLRLEALLNKYGMTKVHIIGHSLGALTAVAFAKTYPNEAAQIFDRVVLLAGPFRGTYAANTAKFFLPLFFALTKTAQQITYESYYVMGLRVLPLPEGPEFHAIAAADDTHYVSPWDSALFLTGAKKYIVAPWNKEIEIDGENIQIIKCHAGHLTMVLKQPVIRAIIEILKTPSA